MSTAKNPHLDTLIHRELASATAVSKTRPRIVLRYSTASGVPYLLTRSAERRRNGELTQQETEPLRLTGQAASVYQQTLDNHEPPTQKLIDKLRERREQR